jgi:hypothetical protein
MRHPGVGELIMSRPLPMVQRVTGKVGMCSVHREMAPPGMAARPASVMAPAAKMAPMKAAKVANVGATKMATAKVTSTEMATAKVTSTEMASASMASASVAS